MRIHVASQNPVKLQATRIAFDHYFADLAIHGYKIASGVPAQPFNDDTFKGAQNRAILLHSKGGADFYVAIEGGMLQLNGRWYCSGSMCVANAHGKRGYGLCSGFQLPSELESKVLQGAELGSVTDAISGETNTKQGKGIIGYLTHDIITRTDFYVPGIIMALTPFLSEPGHRKDTKPD